MRGYNEVDWERANCAGMPHNLFYIFEEQREIKWVFDIDLVRRVCFACPIWRSCLSYALANEQYGIWGGLSTGERRALVAGEPTSVFSRVAQELLNAGISIGEIQEILDEHSRHKRSVENAITD